MRSDPAAVWRESLESHSRPFDLCLLRLHQLWTSDLLYRPRLLMEKHSPLTHPGLNECQIKESNCTAVLQTCTWLEGLDHHVAHDAAAQVLVEDGRSLQLRFTAQSRSGRGQRFLSHLVL